MTPSAFRRRPKAKYDSDPTPAELMSTAAMIHIRFEPRIWLAGRRLISMSTAVLRTASPIAAAMISLRLRSLRSLHRLAMTSSLPSSSPLMACILHREEIVARCLIAERQILLPGHPKPRPLDANYL